jgi:hypothetical protein
MIVVTQIQWFNIGDGFKSMTPLTKRRQVAEQSIVEGGSMKLLTEGIDFKILGMGEDDENNTND